MQRRNFTATTVGLISGYSILSGLSKPSVSVSFKINRETLNQPAESVQSMIVEFNSMNLTSKYIDDSSPVEITYGITVGSSKERSNEKTIQKRLVNGVETDVSEKMEPVRIRNIDIRKKSSPGYVFVEISHPSGVSETYSDSYVISGYGVDDGLTNYWPIIQSDTASKVEDVVGDKNGEIIGSGTVVTGETTKAEFDGGYIKLPNVPIQDSFSVSAWCKSQRNRWSSNGIIACSRQHNGFILHAQDGSSNWSGYVLENFGSNNYQQIGTSGISDIGEWNHYAITYNHESKIGRVYLNGSYKTQNTLSVSRDGSDNVNIYLGSDDPELGFGSRDLNGSVSDFRIYDRVLTDSEVSDIYSLERT